MVNIVNLLIEKRVYKCYNAYHVSCVSFKTNIMSSYINIDLLIEIMEEEQCGCFNGAYIGDDYWEEERYTDMRLRLERRSVEVSG